MITVLLLIFIAGSILAVLKIVQQIVAERKCATDFEMSKFYNGTLKRNDAAYRRFIAHLGICEKCQNRLHNFQQGDDSVDHLMHNKQ